MFSISVRNLRLCTSLSVKWSLGLLLLLWDYSHQYSSSLLMRPDKISNVQRTPMPMNILRYCRNLWDRSECIVAKLWFCSQQLQGWAKEWSLGCVNRAPRPEGVWRRVSRNLGTTLLPSPVYEPWIPVHLWIAFFGISDVELHSLFHSCHLPIMSENFPYDQDAANDIYEEWQSYRDVEPYEPASFICNNRPKHK